MQYLFDALDLIEKRAHYSSRIDWETVRQRAQEIAATASSPSDSYPLIQETLEKLADNHSFFIGADKVEQNNPRGSGLSYGLLILAAQRVVCEVLPGSAADLAGIREFDIVESVNGSVPEASQERYLALDKEQPQRLKLRRGDQVFEVEIEAALVSQLTLPHGRLIKEGVGYLELFAQGPVDQQQGYIEAAQTAIREGLNAGAKSWIVDLRRDRGGNMWPMLAGAGPLMGEGALGAFVERSGTTSWFYEDGASCYIHPETGEKTRYMIAQSPVPTFDYSTRVAVLQGDQTGSSGEMTLVSFLGRPNLRTFGQPSEGLTTAVAMHDLADGAILGIAESVVADRTGKTYDGKIAPDEIAETDWTCYATPQDPVVAAALKWLEA